MYSDISPITSKKKEEEKFWVEGLLETMLFHSFFRMCFQIILSQFPFFDFGKYIDKEPFSGNNIIDFILNFTLTIENLNSVYWK